MELIESTDRLRLLASDNESPRENLALDVERGLLARPRHLSCRFLYDEEGSRLFEEICRLPEYYLTGAEREILAARSPEIASLLDDTRVVVELGSGSAEKTRLLLEAFLARRGRLRYVPVDISRAALETSARALLEDYADLEILAVAAEYHAGLHQISREVHETKLILWLGSNVGNFTRSEAVDFLRKVRADMEAADHLLVGVDLRKDPAVLEAAYDDAQGVTARFSLNLLRRINRELGADFDLDGFAHRACWNAEEGQVEIHLVSRRRQEVRIEALQRTLAFAEGETIHIENSVKYTPEEILAMAAAAGLEVRQQWLDSRSRFSLNLLRPVDGGSSD